MSDPEDTLPEDEALLAAELALRLLEGDDEREASRRLARDPAFAELVAGWQERLIPMTEDIAPVRPARRVKKRLMKRLFPGARVPLSERLWVWKGLAVAALVLAGYLGVQQLGLDQPDRPAALFATQLSGDAIPLQVLAVLDTGSGDLALNRIAGTPATGRAFEVWAILPDAAPVSLGLLQEAQNLRVSLPQDLIARAGEITLAISDEPAGGSPTGAPTGDVLAAAAVTAL